MTDARRDGDDAREASRNVRLAAGVVAPGDDRAVRPKSEAVIFPGGDRGDAREAGRNAGLAAGVVAPGDDRAVRFQGKAVAGTGGDRRNARQADRGDFRIAAPPGDDCANRLESEAVAASGGNRGNVREPVRDVVGAAVPAPGNDDARWRGSRSGDDADLNPGDGSCHRVGRPDPMGAGGIERETE